MPGNDSFGLLVIVLDATQLRALENALRVVAHELPPVIVLPDNAAVEAESKVVRRGASLGFGCFPTS